MYYTYILRSIRTGRFYTGSTQDVNVRLLEHNAGKSGYDKLNMPFELLYQERYQTRAEAVRRERYLKTGRGREYLSSILKKI